MLTTLYIVVWEKQGVTVLDQSFRTRKQAQTYANIELTQMESQGWQNRVQKIYCN